MASILRVNTLTDASSNNSVSTSVVFNGTTKAWVHFDQTDQSMYDNYNIGSITDKAVGETTFNFTSNNTFSAGQFLSISVDAQAALYDMRVTCVWEYDTTT